MASIDDIARLRRVTALEPADAVYTDSLLGGMIDDLGFEAAASRVWQEKAAVAASLVDTTESGSSRRLSQLQENALRMSQQYRQDLTDDTAGKSFTVAVERL